jgi:hypothetical protein
MRSRCVLVVLGAFVGACSSSSPARPGADASHPLSDAGGAGGDAGTRTDATRLGDVGDGGVGTIRPWPDTSASIATFSDQVDTTQMSEAQFQFLATHYAGAQKLVVSAVRHLRQYNAGFLMLHYRLGEALGYRAADSSCTPTGAYLQIIDGDQWVQEWPGDTVVQESWFFHYCGQRVFSCSGGHYLMELDDPGWRSFFSAQVLQQMHDEEADGLFADSYSIPNYFGSTDWQPNLPALDTTFESQWAGLMHAFTDYLRTQFAGRYLFIPNIGNLLTTRDPSDYSNVDGAMIEGFAESGGGQYYAASDWALEMSRALALTAADRILLAQTYPSETDVAERMFILGSYLLVKGTHAYINLDADGQVVQWFPEYSIDLGPATDGLPASITADVDSASGAYVRHFQKGAVYVNPGSASETATLPSSEYQVVPSGGGAVPMDGSTPGTLTYNGVTQVSLAPDTAAVVLLQHP